MNEELKRRIERILDNSDIVWPRYGLGTTGGLVERIAEVVEEEPKETNRPSKSSRVPDYADAIEVSEHCRDAVKLHLEQAIKSLRNKPDFCCVSQNGGCEKVFNCTKIEMCPNNYGFTVEARRGGGWYAAGYWVPVAIGA